MMTTSENNDITVTPVVDGVQPEATPAPAPAFDLKSVIPQEYQSKSYFQNILQSEDPTTELLKQFDNAQQLIGRKAVGVPPADASEEEWKAFTDSVRAKSPDEYELPPIDLGEEKKALADRMNADRSPEMEKAMKDLFHDIGLPKHWADKLVKGYNGKLAEVAGPMYEAAMAEEQALNAGFDQVFAKFGGDKEKAEAAGAKFLSEYVDDTFKPFIQGLPNETLALFASVALKINQKYDTPDTFGDKDINNSSTLDLPALNAELSKLLADPINKKGSTDAGYVAHRDKITAVAKQIAKIQQGG